MVHQLESQLWSLLSLLLHIFRVLKKAMISWKRRADPSVSSSRKHMKDSTFEVKVQPTLYMQDVVSNSDVSKIGEDKKLPRRMSKRPAMIVVPEADMGSAFVVAGKEGKALEDKDVEVEGNGYWLVSRRGRGRRVMEDDHGVITNINGDSKKALFGVFDGHGGRAAVDFASEKLGRNIVEAVSQMEGAEQAAIMAGYLTTDREFLSHGCSLLIQLAYSIIYLEGVLSGVCAATVLLKNGELHASNVGDCRVILSRKGVATALTRDHSAGSEDERSRIESLGGYVTCHNGVWRVHDTLAVSRAIGDANMKKWVISEPETNKLQLTPDCEFLIMASDGLWDKISNQEAVDVVSRHGNLMIKSCETLVEMSISRGERDDITVMVIDLQRFVQSEG